MGCWGMGLTQSDEFCDVYDQFMEEYEHGKSVSDISKEILAQYHEEFDDDDGILHDVYFALAKAEWMCCEQSTFILQRVKEIIESSANLDFYEELGADAKDLKLRKKKLTAFYESLQTPRKKTRKRYTDYNAYEKPFPPMEIGDCFAYKCDSGKRIVVILDWVRLPGWKEQVFCCILKNTYPSSEVKKVNLMEQDIGHIGCYIGTQFLGKSNLQKVGTVNVPVSAKNQILGVDGMVFGDKKDFRRDYSTVPSLKLSKLLETRRVYKKNPDNDMSKGIHYNPTSKYAEPKSFPADIHCGDVFAIKDNGKYRAFVLTEQKEMYFCTAIFSYAWRNIFDEIPSYEQLMKGDVIPLGWFKAETFPEMDQLILVGNYPVLKELSITFPEVINECWKPAYNSLILRKNLFEEYAAELCMPLEKALIKVKGLKNGPSDMATDKTEKKDIDLFE